MINLYCSYLVVVVIGIVQIMFGNRHSYLQQITLEPLELISHLNIGLLRLILYEVLFSLQICKSNTRPIWYIFPGMGSQWQGMGRDLYHADLVFHQTIDQCHACLKKVGFSLQDLLLNADQDTFNNPQNSFVGITSIQVKVICK